MTMPRSILVFTRGESTDDPALSRAFAVAKRFRARVRLVDVLNDIPAGWEPLLASFPVGEARQEAERTRRAQLERMAGTLHDHGLDASSTVRWGGVGLEVVREAIERRSDLVVMEDDRASGLDRAARAVVRQCPVPVWVVKNAPHVPPPRVLAAVDSGDGTHASMEERIVEAAMTAADAMGAEVFVVHAWRPIEEEFEWLPDGFRRQAEKQLVLQETRLRHERAIADLVHGKLPRLPDERVRVVQGVPADVILEVAEEIGADLIVLGTARHADSARLILGTTAEVIVERTPVSILALKPDGFISPVPH